MTKLSTGRRINSGKDGPAALISGERLSAEIKALEAESRTLQRANSNANVSSGGLSQLSGMFADLQGLVTQGANSGALSDAERDAIQLQIDSTADSIRRVTGQALGDLQSVPLSSSQQAALETQLNDAANAAASLATGGANNLASGNFADAQTALDDSLTGVTSAAGTVGAYQKYTVEPQVRSNQVAVENLSASRSRLVDTDFAEETSRLAREKVINAAGIKTLKIAQQQAEHVLSLLAG